MEERFLIYFLLHWWLVVVLVGKYSAKGFIYKVSVKLKSRLIYNLSECDFCIINWIGVILVIIYGGATGYKWGLALYPFISTSIMNINKTRK